MANYFRRLIANKDIREAIALALIGIVLLTMTYFLTVFVISRMQAPLASFEELINYTSVVVPAAIILLPMRV